jgi:hypothetical protein
VAIAFVMEFPRGSQENYDAVCRRLGLDKPKPEWPRGLLTHMAGPLEEGGWIVVDEWESREAFQRSFDDRLRGATEAAGMQPAQQRWFTVHRDYVYGYRQHEDERKAA